MAAATTSSPDAAYKWALEILALADTQPESISYANVQRALAIINSCALNEPEQKNEVKRGVPIPIIPRSMVSPPASASSATVLPSTDAAILDIPKVLHIATHTPPPPTVCPACNGHAICKYWQSCKFGTKCKYPHLTVCPVCKERKVPKCKYYPNCDRGPACRFSHE